MPRVSSNASDKTNESINAKMEPLMQNLVVTTSPVVITGVQRKANIGNYETTDVYCALALPTNWTEAISDENWEEFKAYIGDIIAKGFFVTSAETASRYAFIINNTREKGSN